MNILHCLHNYTDESSYQDDTHYILRGHEIELKGTELLQCLVCGSSVLYRALGVGSSGSCHGGSVWAIWLSLKASFVKRGSDDGINGILIIQSIEVKIVFLSLIWLSLRVYFVKRG